MCWSRLQSDKGICLLGVAYACYTFMMHRLLQVMGTNALIPFQILGYLPCLVIALLFFRAQVLPLLKKSALPIVLFLLIVFAMVAVFQWQKGAGIWSNLQLIFAGWANGRTFLSGSDVSWFSPMPSQTICLDCFLASFHHRTSWPMDFY